MTGWTNNDPTNLIVPPDALPADAQIAIGPDVPPELQTAYGSTIKGAILYRTDADRYAYQAVIDDGTALGRYFVSGQVIKGMGIPIGGPVCEMVRYAVQPTSPGNPPYFAQFFGSAVTGGPPVWHEFGAADVVLFKGTTETQGELIVNGPLTIDQGRKILVDRANVAATSPLSPTSVAATPIVGTLTSVTAANPGAVWEAEWTADMDVTTAGNAPIVVTILVDGIGNYPQVIWDPRGAAVGARNSASQGWDGDFLTAGAHTFELVAWRVSGTGVVRINTVHTTLRVKLYE